jgi:hypothetical protein
MPAVEREAEWDEELSVSDIDPRRFGRRLVRRCAVG